MPTPRSQPAFFVPDGDRFVATESTRGPWSRDHQHGGPRAALLTRALERAAGDGVLLSRLTFDFLRPVPIALLVARAEVVRAGTRVRRLQAALTTADGTPLVHASAVALRTADVLPATRRRVGVAAARGGGRAVSVLVLSRSPGISHRHGDEDRAWRVDISRELLAVFGC